MKKLHIKAIALALGFAFSAGSMAEAIPIPRDVYHTGQDSIAAEHSPVQADAKTQVKIADADALAIENSAEARSHGVAMGHCLAEMKVGFGKP